MLDKIILALQLARIVATGTSDIIDELKGHRERYDALAARRGKAAGEAAKKSSDAAGPLKR